MDVERRIEFILERLAQSRLGMSQHLRHSQQEFSGAALALAEEQKRQREQQTRLAQVLRQQAELHRQQTELLLHIEEKLNALNAIVDGVVRREPKQ